MVPADFVPFFSVMAGVGATLFGLIFLVISIKPEVTAPESTSVMWQAQIASAYSALLNPLVISLFALVPHTTIGSITLIMGVVGQVNTIIMGISLFWDASNWAKKLNRGFFLLISLVIFGFEILYAIQLLVAPGNLSALDNLTTQLVIIYLYGIARAWNFVGARKFNIHEVLTPLVPKNMQEIISDPFHAESTEDANKQRH